MKYFVLSLLFFVGIGAGAWKEVGNSGKNGAGISEQNILFAQANALELFANKPNLDAFVRRVQTIHLKFEVKARGTEAYNIGTNEWTLFPQNFSAFDLDKNDVLNLRESYLLLLTIYGKENGTTATETQRMREEISQILQNQENSRILKSLNFEMQWLQVTENNLGTLVLSMKDKTALVIGVKTSVSVLCPDGSLEALNFYNPRYLRHDKTSEGVVVLLDMRTNFVCDQKQQEQRVLLQILAPESSAKDALTLLDFAAN